MGKAQIHEWTPLKNTHTHTHLSHLQGLSWTRVAECQLCKYQWERPSDPTASQGLFSGSMKQRGGHVQAKQNHITPQLRANKQTDPSTCWRGVQAGFSS